MEGHPGGDWHPGLGGGSSQRLGVSSNSRDWIQVVKGGREMVCMMVPTVTVAGRLGIFMGFWLHIITLIFSGCYHQVAYNQPIGRFFITAYMPGIVLAFVWGLWNPCNLLPEPE